MRDDERSRDGQVEGALRWLRPDAGEELLDVLATVRSGLGLVPAEPLQLGRYRLGDRLGRGGGGVVFYATDVTLGRPVAVKLVSTRGGGEVDRATARLAREARALARVSHPNIVQIFDVGNYDAKELAVADASAAGVYVVMELVEGRDLRTWFDEAPSRNEVLEVMLAAAAGLAAAHDAGVVHRDFKPANVLLGADGSVKVADFGLALDATPAVDSFPTAPTIDGTAPLMVDATRTGDLVGTPAYMAPEQYKGEADERSDQYSFCLALFEGLTGRRPFGRASAAVTLQRKLDGEARGLHLLPSRLRRPIARGLHPNPADRHESMNALLAALRPRRRWGLQAVLFLGAAATVPFLLATDDERCDEELAWSPARAESVQAAIQNAASGAGSAAATVTEVLGTRAEELASALAAACSGDPAVRGCVLSRRNAFGELVETLEGADAAVAERAVQMVDSLEPASECLLLVEEADGLTPPKPIRGKVSAIRAELQKVMSALNNGHTEAAAQQLEPLIHQAEVLNFEPLTSEVTGMRGTVAVRREQVPAALDLLEQAYWSAAGIGHTEEMARAALELAQLNGVLLRDDEATAKWERHAETAVARAPGHRTVFANVKAAIRLTRGDYDEAARVLEEVLPAEEEKRGESHEVSSMLQNLGAAYSRAGRYSEADAVLQRTVSIKRRRLGEVHPDVAAAIAQLAVLREQQEDYRAAVKLNREALEVLDLWSANRHRWHPRVWSNLAASLARLQRFDEAEDAYRHAITDARTLVGDGHPQMVQMHAGLAGSLQAQGRLGEALELFEQLLARPPDAVSRGLRLELAVNAAEACAKICDRDRAFAAFFRADRLLGETVDANPEVRVDLLELIVDAWPGERPVAPADYAARVLQAIKREEAPQEYYRAAAIADRLGGGDGTQRR